MKKAISSSNAPAAIGPYSQAIMYGNVIYVSGQLPIDPKTGNFSSDDIKEQTKASLENIKAILKEAGADFSNVVKTTVFLDNIADFSAMNEIYSSYFSEPYPARAALEVGKLPKGAKIEIEVVAIKNENK